MSFVHDDLCFGCGRANLFGLQLELEPVETGIAGRFFVKQDHQGPPGRAHGGVIAAALDEAMGLAFDAEGIDVLTGRLGVDYHVPVPIGTFVRVEARIDRRGGARLEASAIATDEQGTRLASATATFVEPDPASV